ncbi:MAG: glycosyl hydrolase family 28 protein [Bacteroidota bacterium]
MRLILLPVFLFFYSQVLAQSFHAVNVRSLGASGNKEELATRFIQQALDQVADEGGGTVYFPAGDYTSGSIVLHSNTTLYLEAGATLFASKDAADYPFQTTAKRPTLIFADSAHHIAIRGKGRIHGQAERTYEPLKKVDHFIKDITANAEKAGVDMKMYYKVPPFVRLITLENCTDITLEDFSLIESPSWGITVKWSNRVSIRALYIYSSQEAGVNSDGIDIDGSSNVHISDCTVTTGDDAIVLKSSQGVLPDGTIRHESCENVTVSNCILSSTSTALKIGTESVGDFRHIIFNNCIIRNSNRGLSIVARYGGTIEDVIFSNITIETDRKHFNWWGNGDPIWVVVILRNQRYGLSKVRNILFENIIAHGQGTSKIEGYAPDSANPEGSLIENIQFRNVQFFMEAEDYPDKRADDALMIHQVDGLKLTDVRIHWDEKETEPKWRHGVHLRDVNKLDIDGLTGRQGLLEDSIAFLRLHNVSHANVQDITPTEGTHTMVEVSGKHTQNLHVQNHDRLKRAKRSFYHHPEVPTQIQKRLTNYDEWGFDEKMPEEEGRKKNKQKE